MTESHADRPEIREALRSLWDVEESTLSIRYARMWLNEAAASESPAEEIRHIAEAERELGRAVLASASPSTELCRALELTMRARHEATN